VEYVTALEAMRYERQRVQPVSAEDLKAFAESFDGGVGFAPVKGAYLAPSELFGLMARMLTGRALLPELSYGPESHAPSMILYPKVNAAELAQAAYGQHNRVLGFKQLCDLYKVGGNLLNPVDVFCTMAKAIQTGGQEVTVVQGRLAAEDYVDLGYRFADEWVLWKDDFDPRNIIEHTRLQTWTLKPAVF
jgi:hypothetical protein